MSATQSQSVGIRVSGDAAAHDVPNYCCRDRPGLIPGLHGLLINWFIPGEIEDIPALDVLDQGLFDRGERRHAHSIGTDVSSLAFQRESAQ